MLPRKKLLRLTLLLFCFSITSVLFILYNEVEYIDVARITSNHVASTVFHIPTKLFADEQHKRLPPYSHPISHDIRRLLNLPWTALLRIPSCPHRKTIKDFVLTKYSLPSRNFSIWEQYYLEMNSCELYTDDVLVDQILKELATMPIVSVENMEGGTQIKLLITFANNSSAVAKPMRFDRDYETNPNHFYFTDFERHNAEIAGFHLDRVLGFRRAIPTAGRKVNITGELEANAQGYLKKTFFISPAKNKCFVGQCEYYCDTTHAICGEPDMKELSLQALLPDIEYAPRKRSRSPYRRTYNKRRQLATWQLNASFCDLRVKMMFPYNAGRALLDVIDMYIFDFFMGNQDRHHYEYFYIFPRKEQRSFLLHLDNGRGFGNSKKDDKDILAPLTQCCLIRPSTLKTLLDYYVGPVTLSDALRQSLTKDSISPILAEKHYVAIERRLNVVLNEVVQCLRKADWNYEKVVTPFFFNSMNLTSSEHREEDNEKSPQKSLR